LIVDPKQPIFVWPAAIPLALVVALGLSAPSPVRATAPAIPMQSVEPQPVTLRLECIDRANVRFEIANIGVTDTALPLGQESSCRFAGTLLRRHRKICSRWSTGRERSYRTLARCHSSRPAKPSAAPMLLLVFSRSQALRQAERVQRYGGVPDALTPGPSGYVAP
jgi:hypothetical protein